MSEETPVERRLRDSLPEASAPDNLWERIEAEREKHGTNRPSRRRWVMPTVALGAIVATAVGVTLLLRPTPRSSTWTYQGRRLKVGDTVTADSRSVFLLREPSIGSLALMPGTRLRVTDTGQQKRLKLETGSVSALVIAPPRLFAVETDNGVATDLGCSYELDASPVRAPGILGFFGAKRSVTELTVKTGWVELADKRGKTVLVPAGASCEMVPSSVGLPSFQDSPEILRTLHPHEHGEWPELADALKAAKRPKDTLTLFYLLPRVTEAETPAIWKRLVELVPPPKAINEADLRAGKASAVSAYEEHLKEVWNPPSPEIWNLLINNLRSTK